MKRQVTRRKLRSPYLVRGPERNLHEQRLAALKRAKRKMYQLEKQKTRQRGYEPGTRIELQSSQYAREDLAGSTTMTETTRAQRRRFQESVRIYSVWPDGSWRLTAIPSYLAKS